MFYNNDYFNRFTMMLDESAQQKLQNASVIVFGVGGVGGALANFLVRCGIKRIGIVDFDYISPSNINRQLVAFSNNIGKLKVDELEIMLKNINPNVIVDKYPFKLDSESINKIDFSNYDIIADCIDDIRNKKLLITSANKLNKYIICACGAGNRYEEIPNFEVTDINKTSYDPIAKILRKFCKENGINKLDVCYTKQKATKFDCKIIASVVYYPISMACCITAKIINKILTRGGNGNNTIK